MTREEELDWLYRLKSKIYVYMPKEWIIPMSDALNTAIKALESEPKTGHWIIIDDCEKFIAKCSECGQIEDSRMIGKYAYCHCGARMVEPQEGANE